MSDYGRAVRNNGALDRAKKLDKDWKPEGRPPYVGGRDPYENMKRTPENNFAQVGQRKSSASSSCRKRFVLS